MESAKPAENRSETTPSKCEMSNPGFGREGPPEESEGPGFDGETLMESVSKGSVDCFWK